MSKTQLGLFAIIAISAMMIVSIQYSEAAKVDLDIQVGDIDKKHGLVTDVSIRDWINQEVTRGACGEDSNYGIKNGYRLKVWYEDDFVTLEEKSTTEFYDSEGEVYAIATVSEKNKQYADGEKATFHKMTKINCMNDEKDSVNHSVLIVHKNGKITEHDN